MRKLTTLVLCLALTLTAAACSSNNKKKSHKKDSSGGITLPAVSLAPDVELPEDSIIIMDRYINFAWGYQDAGWFVMSDGSGYYFDFSELYYDSDVLYEIMADKDRFQNIVDTQSPDFSVSEYTLKEIYALSLEIDEDAEFVEEYNACDAGEDCIYVYGEPATESSLGMILLSEYGDNNGYLDDPSAKAILLIAEKIL